MADYFTKFSVIIELPDEAAQKEALALADQARRIRSDDEQPGTFPASLADVVEDWQFETQGESLPDRWGVWLHSDNGGIDAVCAFIQHLLREFTPKSRVTLQWSDDCSRPRVDAYGGGAAIVTAGKIKTMSTWQWLQRHS